MLDQPDPARLSVDDMTDLQQSHGNRTVVALLRSATPPPPVQRDMSDLQQVGAGAINELSIVHNLLRAINQTPTVKLKLSMDKPKRDVDFSAVDEALTGLTPTQVKTVVAEYRRYSERDLRDDLVGGIFPSALNAAQKLRVEFLLQGTALESGPTTTMAVGLPGTDSKEVALGAEDAAKVVARNRAFADSASLKLLIDKDDKASDKLIFAMLRKSAEANDWIAAGYERNFDKPLEPALAGLGEVAGPRALALRYGQWDRADAIAIDAVRKGIAKLDQAKAYDVMGSMAATLRSQRRALVAQIQEILATMTEEAGAVGATVAGAAGARAAMTDKLAEVMAMQVEGGEGRSLGDLLRATVGSADMVGIDALATGDAVEIAAAKLAEADAAGKMSTKLVADTLRGLRGRAELDVRRNIKLEIQQLQKAGASVDDLQAKAEALQDQSEAAIDALAKQYTARLTTTVDRFAATSTEGREVRTFATIVASADAEKNRELMTDLVKGGGKLSAVEDLQHAIRRNELGPAIDVLRSRVPAERKLLVAEYDAARGKGPTLAQAVAGKMLRRFDGFIGTEDIRLPRTDEEAAIAELIEAPDAGSESELSWTFKWTRDTYERAIAEGGITGKIADVGGREVRDMLNDSSNMVTDAITDYKKATSPAAQNEALRKLRNARQAINVDKTAYVKETDAIRAAIADAVALVADIALTIMLPGAASLVTKLAASIAANVGSKMVVLQDQYTPEAIGMDVLGALVGLPGGGIGKKAGEQLTKAVGGAAVRVAGKYGIAVSPELAKLGKGLLHIGGEMGSNAGSTMATNIATGKDITEGVWDATVTGTIKSYGTQGLSHVIKGGAGTGATTGGAGGGDDGGHGRGGGHVPDEGGAPTPTPKPAPTDGPAPKPTEDGSGTRTIADGEPVHHTPMALEPTNSGTGGGGDGGGGGGGRKRPPTEDTRTTDFDSEEPTVETKVPMALPDEHTNARTGHGTGGHEGGAKAPVAPGSPGHQAVDPDLPAGHNDAPMHLDEGNTRTTADYEHADQGLTAVETAHVAQRIRDLAAGEGLSAPPSPQAVQAAVATLRNPKAPAAARKTALEVVAARAVADYRAYESAKLGHEGGGADAAVLNGENLRGRCGSGRDITADSVASMTKGSSAAVVIERYQVQSLGIQGESHAFTILRSGGRTFLIDPTFAQFADPTSKRGQFTAGEMLRSSEGSHLAQRLMADGFVELDPATAHLYVVGLGAHGPQAGVASTAADSLLTGDRAFLVDVARNGEVAPAAPGHFDPDSSDNVLGREGVDGSIGEISGFIRALEPGPARDALLELRGRLIALTRIPDPPIPTGPRR